jgi:hypothetical protein
MTANQIHQGKKAARLAEAMHSERARLASIQRRLDSEDDLDRRRTLIADAAIAQRTLLLLEWIDSGDRQPVEQSIG